MSIWLETIVGGCQERRRYVGFAVVETREGREGGRSRNVSRGGKVVGSVGLCRPPTGGMDVAGVVCVFSRMRWQARSWTGRCAGLYPKASLELLLKSGASIEPGHEDTSGILEDRLTEIAERLRGFLAKLPMHRFW